MSATEVINGGLLYKRFNIVSEMGLFRQSPAMVPTKKTVNKNDGQRLNLQCFEVFQFVLE